MNESAIVACVPVAEAPATYPGKHYEQVPCPTCGRAMYLGPRSKAKVAAGVPMLCMLCILRAGYVASDNVVSLGGP